MISILAGSVFYFFLQVDKVTNEIKNTNVRLKETLYEVTNVLIEQVAVLLQQALS